ncbi:response regulator [Hydrogenispora sp. UU3]|uniref:Response regulator n=1 Tax=Capillibacterium thermochitinicola TaxID=2699427 RepID=A0A8J6LRJ1_9FIRM|nr:response regulator [Capillibacterium thermochitinicola]
MYKVMIVDDEVLVRIGLKTTINWEDIGFTVAAEASNGEQGFEQYKKHHPDVLITDIKMPKRDGLWLIEEIRKENQDIKILVLTCYDEFSYARKALQLGADDYILKSEVEDEELISVMKKIKNKIDVLRRTKNSQLRMKSDRHDMKRSLLNDLIKSDFYVDEKIVERCAELDFTVDNTRFVWASIGIGEQAGQNNPKVNKMKHNAVLNIVYDQLQEKGLEYLYNHLRDNYLFLISAREMTAYRIQKIFELVSNAARQYFDLPLQIIYTDPFDELRERPDIYNDFIEKTGILFYSGPQHGLIQNTKEINFKDVNVFILKEQYSPSVIEYIGQGDFASLKELTYEIGHYFKDNKIKPMTVKIFYSTLAGDIFTSYGQLFEDNDDFLKYEDFHSGIVNLNRLEKVSKAFFDFAVKVMDELRQVKNGELIINKAIKALPPRRPGLGAQFFSVRISRKINTPVYIALAASISACISSARAWTFGNVAIRYFWVISIVFWVRTGVWATVFCPTGVW